MGRQLQDRDDDRGNDFLHFWKQAAGMSSPRASEAPARTRAAPPPSPPPRRAAPPAELPRPAPIDSRHPTPASGSLVNIGSVGGHVIILGGADKGALADLLHTPGRATA